MGDEKLTNTEAVSVKIELDSDLAERLRRFLDLYEREATALEDWMTGDIVEDMLNISTRTLQTLRDNGTLHSAKLGGKLYYKRSDIERILEDSYQMRRLHNPDGYGAERC